MTVEGKMRWLLGRLKVANTDTIASRKRSITKRLNIDFWGIDSDDQHSRYVGSFGRGTAIHGISDIDMMYQLPSSLYQRFNQYANNGQSALLQTVKNSIAKKYPLTDVSGDGQVVVVKFQDMHFDVLPVFNTTDSRFLFPDSNNGGSWRTYNPVAEIQETNKANLKSRGKVKHLSQMMRAWREINNVPISGFLIDTLVLQFLESWKHSKEGLIYYPIMIADFLYYLSEQDKRQEYWRARGSSQYVYRTGIFENKALSSFSVAYAAIESEKTNNIHSANQYWKTLFGKYFSGQL